MPPPTTVHYDHPWSLAICFVVLGFASVTHATALRRHSAVWVGHTFTDFTNLAEEPSPKTQEFMAIDGPASFGRGPIPTRPMTPLT